MFAPAAAALSLSAAAALVLLATPAFAAEKPEKEKWETAIVGDKPGPLALKPDKAYILLEADSLVMPTFMRLPTEDDATKHAATRAEALAKEHARYERKLASYEQEMKALQNTPASVKRPTKPAEPTEANFDFPRYEQLHSFLMGPQNRFSKVAGSVYLQEVPPGEYLFYGMMMTCACLGTVSFEAPAGKVVTLKLSLPFAEAMRLPKEQRPKTALDLPRGTTSMQLGASTFKDTRLPQGSVIAPAFHPAGQRPNWPGQEVDRVMAIPGVFAYERDKQVPVAPLATQ